MQSRIFLTAITTVFVFLPASGQAKTFSGDAAFNFTRQAVDLGPRPDGSPSIVKLRTMIKADLASRRCEIISDKFIAQTPDGPVPMENIIAKFPGKSGRAVAVTGHYDTLRMPRFVGANDGGSSTGFLLEMAAALQGGAHRDDIYLVFFDGEEAFHKWSDTDSLYGSRHLAEKWSKDGTNARLKALINVDMIGDKNLTMLYDITSAASVRKLIWDTADSLGYAREFPRTENSVEDDHVPFLKAGVRAVDLIDFQSQNTFWHTPQDTMDKLSPHSFEVIGAVVMKSLSELEDQK
ncbi:MAG TPA: M28 family peptidase [Bryobacteraceae bacterium]|jgi:Zn-dependent M28 family amino/carboxypeptidase|nr:M28 family peptidase [Bryobacteraceae bacterium]